jgi:hypothetical protein
MSSMKQLIRLAVKPRVMVGNIFERIKILTTNMADETIDSISKFFEKTYTKISHIILMNCKSVSDFGVAYPALAQRITSNNKDMIISSFLLGNRKLFTNLLKKVGKKLNKQFHQYKLQQGSNEVQNDLID